ncbi:DUF445 domain-containing protein [Chitinophaga nivalis]|uniref:DUF445 family protein n=1 Tax=Chitinophaga nivalis TaxID=2991709 RepID=A0ABT3IQH5_9BACT|nr:DUF445 family protein [Chitinophaga nivalis]MCW3464081.1 DUF445 family protein [Chitinophaga nivalis]MCW3486229.1 DUF445 family protein [Chitinophaga nivalis]
MSYIIPIIAAIIGWLINSLAIKLLFHPRRPVNLGLFTLQGLFPKRQQALAARIGALVGQQLFSFQEVKTKLTDPDKIKNIIPVVETHLDSFLRERLPKAMPVLSMFIGDSIVQQIKTHLVAEMDTLFPVMIGQYLDNVEQDLDLEKIVTQKIAGISAEKMESLTQELLSATLQHFKWLGAVTGFLIGLITLLLHHLL